MVYEEMKIGDVVGLRLMRRERGSLAVVSVGNYAHANPDVNTSNRNHLCKLVIADPSEVSFFDVTNKVLSFKLRDKSCFCQCVEFTLDFFLECYCHW